MGWCLSWPARHFQVLLERPAPGVPMGLKLSQHPERGLVVLDSKCSAAVRSWNAHAAKRLEVGHVIVEVNGSSECRSGLEKGIGRLLETGVGLKFQVLEHTFRSSASSRGHGNEIEIGRKKMRVCLYISFL